MVEFLLGMINDKHGWTLVLNNEYEWVLLLFEVSGGNGWTLLVTIGLNFFLSW
jgi:hypothetical protein